MRHLFLTAGLFLLACIVPNKSCGQPNPGAEYVSVNLISEFNTVPAGYRFFTGVHFEIEEGWHIYWRNPGDSGIPTDITWDLPDGFRVDRMQWPYPETFREGHLVTHGYKLETVLLQPLFAANPPEGENMIRARVDYLVCKESCLPGFAEVEMPIQVDDIQIRNSSAISLIAQFRDKVPGFIPTTGVSASVNDDVITLTIPGRFLRDDPDLDRIHFFGEEDDLVESSAEQVKRITSDGRLEMQLDVSRYRSQPVESVNGVIVNQNGWRNTSSPNAIRISVNVN